MSLIAEYHRSQKQIDDIYNHIEVVNVLSTKETHRLKYDIYRPQMDALRDAEFKAIQAVEKDRDEKVAKMKEDIKARQVVVDQVKRILTLFNVSSEDHAHSNALYRYERHDEKGNYLSDARRVTIDPVGCLIDNAYLNIKVYLVENGKPKNKYCLYAVGHSIFAGEHCLGLDKFCYGYIRGVHEVGSNVRSVLKEGPVAEDLLKWYEKNKATLMADYIADHRKVEQDYVEAMELMKDIHWTILHLEDRKDYYENSYSGGTETPEYKEICGRLSALKKVQQTT